VQRVQNGALAQVLQSNEVGLNLTCDHPNFLNGHAVLDGLCQETCHARRPLSSHK